MARAAADHRSYHLLYRAGALPVVQECDGAFDRQADHDAKPVSLCGVQHPAWRRSICADAVDTVGRHQGEVPLHHRRGRELVSPIVGLESPVGDAANVEFLAADEDELASHAWAKGGREGPYRKIIRALCVGKCPGR